MNQDEIFRLLLIVLLSANRQLNNLNEEAAEAAAEDDDDAVIRFNYTPLNELLIFAMLLSVFDFTNNPTDCPPPGPRNTTF